MHSTSERYGKMNASLYAQWGESTGVVTTSREKSGCGAPGEGSTVRVRNSTHRTGWDSTTLRKSSVSRICAGQIILFYNMKYSSYNAIIVLNSRLAFTEYLLVLYKNVPYISTTIPCSSVLPGRDIRENITVLIYFIIWVSILTMYCTVPGNSNFTSAFKTRPV